MLHALRVTQVAIRVVRLFKDRLIAIWDLLLKRAGEKVRGAADGVTVVACLRK